MPIASEKVADSNASNSAEAAPWPVRLFRNGANQAVRIPKEFELPGKDALIHREGNKLIIEAIESKHPKGSAAALLAALESMRDWKPIFEVFPDVDEGLLPLDDIEL